MTNIIPVYNERSWAIDIISEINTYCLTRKRSIARAGGENTVGGGTGKLFPDVLLFSDKEGSAVLQGWELKMPDTEITDIALISNATEKAKRLHLDSFLVWNVNEAVLYVRYQEDHFEVAKSWPALNILKREDVKNYQDKWKELLYDILDDLNSFFQNGKISGATIDIAINDTLFVDYLNQYVPKISKTIQQVCITDAEFEAELSIWWLENKIEHPNSTKYEGIARVNLINWINRFLFAHYLRNFYNTADHVLDIVPGTGISQAIIIFEQISMQCDFMNIFRPAVGQEYLDDITWAGLIQLNMFLIDLRLDRISQETFQRVIDNALMYSRKKLAGQFSTPKELAELLVHLTIHDRSKPVLDPCCGTGTIARAVYDLKQSVGVTISESLRTIWASDKFAFPLQLCSIALSDPQGMGELIQVFKHDALDLNIGQDLKFTHPLNGGDIILALPKMHAVVSNLPFVRFEDIEKLNPDIIQIKEELINKWCAGHKFSGRADLYAYLILKLSDLLDENGRLGVITSNSWLASEWGRGFKKCLLDNFKIEKVIISGEGRWFKQPNVVTTILILQNKQLDQDRNEEQIEFCTTTARIEQWGDQTDGIELLASGMLAKNAPGDGFRKYTHNLAEVERFERLGIEWNAFFTDLSWVSEVEPFIVSANNFFDIARGERRGWNAMFYPQPGHGIEDEYIQPVLLSSADLPSLLASADQEAFCCSDSIELLTQKNMTGALSWIAKFEQAKNKVGIPLPTVLSRKGMYWYEMSNDTMADLVITMNPDKRLAFHRFHERSFVDQRLIRLTSKIGNEDIDICHALLNSVIGLFFIEASGFGRGLGALDLNATKLRDNFHMLDYRLLSADQRKEVLLAFEPLLGRNILDLPAELKEPDRVDFDNMVLGIFGLSNLRDSISDTLLQLFHIRQTAAGK